MNWLITTRIAVKASDSGDSLAKSIAIFLKRHSPVGIGTIFVCLLFSSDLLFRHLTHPAIYLATSAVYLSHVKFLETTSCIQHLPYCIATCLSWWSHSTTNLYSYATTQSLFFPSHVVTSIPSTSLSSIFSSSLTLLLSTSNSCPPLKKFASIMDFSSSKHLYMPSGWLSLNTGLLWMW